MTRTVSAGSHSQYPDDNSTMITREDLHPEFRFEDPSPKTISLPVSDTEIIRGIDTFSIPHPQLFIDLLSQQHNEVNVNRVLAPFLLFHDQKHSTNIIECIAESLSYSLIGMLHTFARDVDEDDAVCEWRRLFGDIPFDSTREIRRDWSLRSISDLSELHILCCALGIRVILLLPLRFEENEVAFSMTIGKTNASFVNIFVCGNPQRFYFAEPRTVTRTIERISSSVNLSRAVFPGNGAVIYVNPKQIRDTLESLGSEFDDVICHFVVDPSLISPVLKFTESNKILTIEIRHPQDELTRDQIIRTLQGCGSKFTTTEPAIEGEKALGQFNNSQFYSDSLIVEKVVEERDVVVQQDLSVKSMKNLNDLVWAFERINFPTISEKSSLGMYEVLRMFTPSVRKKPEFVSKYSRDPPILMKHVEGFAMTDAANHPFGHFLCLHSLFHAAANSRTLYCKRCHHNRRSEQNRNMVMIPLRKENSPYLRWICINCWGRMTTHEHTNIKNQFPVFHSVIDVENQSESNENKIAKLQNAADRLQRSIMSLRSDPIGVLKALIPRIDSAFSSLTEVLKLFRQRMLRMKHVTIEELLSIQNSSEYKARIGTMERAVLLPEPDAEVVDTNVFVEYLKSFFMKEPGVTDYMEIEPLSEIRETLVSEAMSALESANKPTVSTIDELQINPKNLADSSLDFDIHLILEGEVSVPPKKHKVYFVRQIGDNCTVSSSPISKLKTRNKDLVGLFLNGATFTAVFVDLENLIVHLYVIPVASSIDIDLLAPQISIPDIGRCKASFSENGQSIALLGVGGEQNPLHAVIMNDGVWEDDVIGDMEGTEVCWNPHSEESVVVANDTTFWVVDFTSGEAPEPVEIEKKNPESTLVKLSVVANVVWATFSDGECVVLAERDQEEEEQATVSQKLGHNVTAVCSASLRGDAGFLSLDDDGNMKFCQSKISSPAVDVSLVDGNRNSLRFPLGVLDANSGQSKSCTPRQITAAFCRAFPILAGYINKSAFTAIDCNLSPYRPTAKNLTFGSAIRSTYDLYESKLHLHTIETCRYNHTKFQTFVFIDCAPGGGSFIDAIFGTSLAIADIDGIWVTQRARNDVADTIVYFHSKKPTPQLISTQLIASYLYAENVFLLCQNHKLATEIIQILETEKPLRQKLRPTVILFTPCANRKSFETKLVEESLKNASPKVGLSIESMELIQGPVDLDAVPGTRQKWIERLNKPHNDTQEDTITQIKKTIALFATFCEFPRIPLQRIAKALGLR